MNKKLTLTVFTDPTCPFAYSAEPTRWRLQWLYGDQLVWSTRMISLSGYDGETSSITPQLISHYRTNLREQYGMPIDNQEMVRVPKSIVSTRTYIAVRRHQPEAAERLLRALRIAAMSNKLIDEDATIADVVNGVGLEASQVARWAAEPETEAELTSDAEAARNPSEAALNMRHKLSQTSTERTRYSAPSYVFSVDGVTQFELPGFWPLEVYETAIGNVFPNAKRKADPTSVQEVLNWADAPLATVEVAQISSRDIADVREELKKVATFSPLGQDGFWTIA